MKCDVEKYWVRLLGILEEFADGNLSIVEYKAHVRSIWDELSMDHRGFCSMTTLTYVPLSRFLLSSLSEVDDDEIDEAGEPRETARWLFKYILDIFLLGSKTYTHPAAMSIFGTDDNPVISDQESLPTPIKDFVDLAEAIAETPNITTDVIKKLHNIYYRIKPDTVIGIICATAIEVLLPWLQDGIPQDQISVFEQNDYSVSQLSLILYEKWICRLKGKAPFVVRLRCRKDIVVVGIDDWPQAE